MSRRRTRRNNSVVGFFQKDPFGVLWFSLAFLGVLIAKWWYVQPPSISPENCLGCVVAIFVVVAVAVTFLLSVFWVLWTAKRQPMGLVFLFLIGLGVVGCAALVDVLAQQLFSQLYFRGMLNWEGTEVTFLLDDFLHHNAGLYLGVLMIYTMVRIAVCPDFEHRKYVIPINIIFILVAAFLLYIGIMLY
jgi:hypothetical protein